MPAMRGAGFARGWDGAVGACGGAGGLGVGGGGGIFLFLWWVLVDGGFRFFFLCWVRSSVSSIQVSQYDQSSEEPALSSWMVDFSTYLNRLCQRGSATYAVHLTIYGPSEQCQSPPSPTESRSAARSPPSRQRATATPRHDPPSSPDAVRQRRSPDQTTALPARTLGSGVTADRRRVAGSRPRMP